MPSIALDLTVSVIISLLPILLHVLDKLMETRAGERFLPFSHEILREQMANDARAAVKQVGAQPELFNAVRTYFSFEREGHFIIAVAIFNMASLYVAQTQCTGSFLVFRAPTFIGMLLVLGFLFVFVRQVAVRRFEPADTDPLKTWRRASYCAFAGVIVLDIYLHVTCAHEAKPAAPQAPAQQHGSQLPPPASGKA